MQANVSGGGRGKGEREAWVGWRAGTGAGRAEAHSQTSPGEATPGLNLRLPSKMDLEALARDFADVIEVQLYGDHSNDEFRNGTSSSHSKRLQSNLIWTLHQRSSL